MKEFNWNEFRNNKMAVHCKTEEEAKDFIKVAYENDCKWSDRYRSFTNFDVYGCKTTYTCGSYKKNQLEWCYYNYFKENNYKIYEWSDFMKQENKGDNFKIRVVKIIGDCSVDVFGSIGTVFEVKNGVFKDKEGFTWTNDGELYKSVEDINNQINKEDCSFRTRFELVKEQQDEYDLTIQDVINNADEKAMYECDNIKYRVNRYGELELKHSSNVWSKSENTIKQILNMKFKKLEPKRIKKYIDTMKAVQMISENKIVWCEYKDNFIKFNEPKTSKIRIDVLLKGKFYLLINEDEMEG